jgi:integrase
MAELAVVDDRRLLWDATRALIYEKIDGGVSRTRVDTVERVLDRLCQALGKDAELESITAEQLRDWIEGLAESMQPNTVATYASITKQFFAWAMREKLLEKNPAVSMRVAFARSERLVEVPAEAVWRIIDAAELSGEGDVAMALRLARWGGLRAGEILRVQVQDVVPEQDRFRVRDTKREHTGHGQRWVPIFPELEPLRKSVRRTSQSVDDPLLPSLTSCSVMGHRAKRLARGQGIPPWPRFWQNMRATRETELMDDPSNSIKDVCLWIGNSPSVAMEHYAMVRGESFRRAARGAVEA